MAVGVAIGNLIFQRKFHQLFSSGTTNIRHWIDINDNPPSQSKIRVNGEVFK
jgi:hypothetical protein